jgi:hypothetical protein
VSEDVLDEAIKNKFDLIVDGTLKDTKKALDRIEKLVNAGYEVHVIGICVTPEESWAGCEKRYNLEKTSEVGHGRWVPKEVHDEAIDSMVISLIEIQLQGKVETLTIEIRGRTELHKSFPKTETPKERKSAVKNLIQTFIKYGERKKTIGKDYI